MAIGIIDDSLLANIGNAIRNKNSSTTQYLPSEMPAAIEAIETGIDTTISDGTAATESDIVEGKTSFVNGEKIVGNVLYTDRTYGQSPKVEGSNMYLTYSSSFEKRMIGGGKQLKITSALSNFGDASNMDVVDGKTFTSTAGLKETGALKLNGAHIWKRYALKKQYNVKTTSLGNTSPSDLTHSNYFAGYTTTEDGYFYLTEGTSVVTFYALPDNATNGKTKYIYKINYVSVNDNGVTYYKLTVDDTYTTLNEKGDFIGYITSDDASEYPVNGISNGYWYTYVNVVDVQDTTMKTGTFTVGSGSGSASYREHSFDTGLSTVNSITIIKTDKTSSAYYCWVYNGTSCILGNVNSSGSIAFSETSNISFSGGTCTIGSATGGASIKGGTYIWFANGA